MSDRVRGVFIGGGMTHSDHAHDLGDLDYVSQHNTDLSRRNAVKTEHSPLKEFCMLVKASSFKASRKLTSWRQKR